MENNSEQNVEIEIHNIFNGLRTVIFENFKNIILDKFYKIQPKFRKKSKYRDPKLLIPLIFYIYFRIYGYKITKSQLLAVSQISSTDFNDFLVQVRNYLSRMSNVRRYEKL